jgi:hypothetical protein
MLGHERLDKLPLTIAALAYKLSGDRLIRPTCRWKLRW